MDAPVAVRAAWVDPVVDRIVEHFGGSVPRDEVEVLVLNRVPQWSGARIADYVPILTEREVKTLLRRRVAAM